jgi:hypothetical protein
MPPPASRRLSRTSNAGRVPRRTQTGPADPAGGHGLSGSSGIAGCGGELRRAAGGLWPSASFVRRVLDECHDAAGHEPGCSYGFARTGHLNDFDNAPSRRDFDPATSAGGDDLVGPRTVVRSYDNFHAVALHSTSVLWRSRQAPLPQAIAWPISRSAHRGAESQLQGMSSACPSGYPRQLQAPTGEWRELPHSSAGATAFLLVTRGSRVQGDDCRNVGGEQQRIDAQEAPESSCSSSKGAVGVSSDPASTGSSFVAKAGPSDRSFSALGDGPRSQSRKWRTGGNARIGGRHLQWCRCGTRGRHALASVPTRLLVRGLGCAWLPIGSKSPTPRCSGKPSRRRLRLLRHAG